MNDADVLDADVLEIIRDVFHGDDLSTEETNPFHENGAAAVEEHFAIRVYTTRELAALDIPNPADPLAGPFLRRGMITLIGGLTGHGKTTWIAQAVKAAAAGGDFLGETAAGGARVLVLDLEQHLHTIQRVLRETGLDETDHVDYAPIPEGLALERNSDQLDALELILARGYDLVVIDPFYKLHEADSSDELAARALVALLRRWTTQFGFALLTATHCRKLPTGGRNFITIDDLFGSSLFTRDPELVLGIQRHGDLTKVYVFKSREPGLELGQTFELLYTRGRGLWPKPTIDPEERAARLSAIGQAAIAWIANNPGQSENKVTKAVGEAQKCSKDLVAEALTLQVKSGLLPEPVRGSRNAKLWYPHNHAPSTSPEPLWGEDTESPPTGLNGDDFPAPPDHPVGVGGATGEVDEASRQATADRLAERHPDLAGEPT